MTDELAGWRRHFWGQSSPADCGRDLLGLLARAEYGRVEAGPWTADLSTEDLAAAALRRAARDGLATDPAQLVTSAHASPTVRTALAEAWAVTLAAGHGRNAAAVLRRRLLARPPAGEAAFLLDLAESGGLQPLTAAECAAMARSADRAERHAAWRYLAGIAHGAEVLPRVAPRTADRYEALLLAAVWQRAVPGAAAGQAFRQAVRPLPAEAGSGLTVAQSMLLGRLDEPGAGLSGGMSVLLGGLGDALTGTGRVGRVMTLATAGPTDLGRRQPLVVRRGPEHWVMRIPVDAPEPLDPGPRPCTARHWPGGPPGCWHCPARPSTWSTPASPMTAHWPWPRRHGATAPGSPSRSHRTPIARPPNATATCRSTRTANRPRPSAWTCTGSSSRTGWSPEPICW
ncbi:hypothetical protein [Kitasatospora paranensis]|uniref:hypothetical protein n=1 Tax=Kitasatospora paranensis TaxID=258053 RepID=UPI0031E87B80